MGLEFHDATDADAGFLAALSCETAAALTARFGQGQWFRAVVVRGMDTTLHRARGDSAAHRGAW